MNDGEALLRAIRANPDEDTPRLIYADYLQEHGDEARAEFIRVECALFRTPEGDPARSALRTRRQALWAQHGARWRAALSGRRSGIKWAADTSRGFFNKIVVSDVRAAERHGPAILASEAVRRVCLKPPATLSGFARLPLLETAEDLDVRYETGGGAGLAALAASPHAGNLRRLTVSADPAEEARLVDLLASPAVPRLTTLAGMYLSVPAPCVALPSPASPALKLLQLGDCRFAPGALDGLFGLPAAGALEMVWLQHCDDEGDALAAALASARHVRGLWMLNLKETALTRAGAAAFAARHLRSLLQVVLTRGLAPTDAVRVIRQALPEANVRVDARR